MNLHLKLYMLCSYKHDNSKVATHRHESLTQFTDTRAGPPRPPATWPRCTTPWPAWPASASGTWPRRPTMKRYFLFSWWLFQVFSNNSYQKQISFDVNRIFARCNYKLERLEIQKFSFEIFSGVYCIFGVLIFKGKLISRAHEVWSIFSSGSRWMKLHFLHRERQH